MAKMLCVLLREVLFRTFFNTPRTWGLRVLVGAIKHRDEWYITERDRVTSH